MAGEHQRDCDRTHTIQRGNTGTAR
jgi:hypothetical protein